MIHKTYETDRLILRTLPPSYAKIVLDYYARNRDFLEPWEPKREAYFYTRHHQKQMLKWDQKSMEDLSMLRLWIFKKEDRNHQQTIGTVCISNIMRGIFQSCFLGYKLDQDYLNQGYITEAVQKIIEIAFEEMNLHRVEANIMPRNLASLQVVEKLGFHSEGLGIDYLKINGQWEDHLHMVKINR